MIRLLLITFIAFSVGCNSNTTDKEPKIESTKKDKIVKDSTLNVVEQSSDLSIIYDTLVFTDNMRGELLTEKFVSGRPELNFYKRFIIPKKINELIVLKEKDIKTEIRYLGEIKDLNNKSSYHIITRFRIFGINTLTPKGRSDVAFVNGARNNIIVYNLPMPENLPRHIRNNVLFFEYDNTKVGVSIFGGLPPLFCLPKIGCN